MNQTIEINIDELVLHGFQPGDKKQISEALEIALMHVFAQRNVSPAFNQSADIHFLNAGSFGISSKSKPVQVATGIANSIHTTLSGKSK